MFQQVPDVLSVSQPWSLRSWLVCMCLSLTRVLFTHRHRRSPFLQQRSDKSYAKQINKLFVMPKIIDSPKSHRHNRSQQVDHERTSLPRSHTVHNHQKLKVFIKFKPEARHPDALDQVTYLNEHQIEIKTTLKHRIYQFDHVFSPRECLREVFDIGCRDIIEQVFRETYEEGSSNNGLIFVYGNTGTGKTYSMGLLDVLDEERGGLVPDALRYVFGVLKRSSYKNYRVSVSFCEIYMDEVYDLLALQNEAKLMVREDAKTKEPFLQNQMVIQVQSNQQAFQIINIGLDKRRVAEQRMNRRSSRGHGVITLHIDPNNGQRPGKLCFVDLAGCQRLKDSQSKGTTLTEALHINSSLSSLQTLLMSISEQSIRNYRASKLTRLLQPFLERGKINLFVTTTRDSAGTIEFAKRCKGIRFMEKDLRQSVTPVKKAQKTTAKWSKEVQELTQFKRLAIEKEKRYLECINSLIHCLSKLSTDVEECLRNQKFKTKFSFSEIMSNRDLQEKINRKLQGFERKEQQAVELLLQRLEATTRPEQLLCNDFGAQQLLQLQKTAQDYSHEIGQQLKGLSALNDYRSIYKKEFFTSELKLHLLQQRCNSFENKINQLTPYMDVNDKRVQRRLRELGISVNNSQNQPHLRNKQARKERQRQDSKRSALEENGYVKQSNGNMRQSLAQQESVSDRQRVPRRSAIFIDEM